MTFNPQYASLPCDIEVNKGNFRNSFQLILFDELELWFNKKKHFVSENSPDNPGNAHTSVPLILMTNREGQSKCPGILFNKL